MWGSFLVLELTLGVWPCPQGLQAGAREEGEGKGNERYNGGPRLGSGAGERGGGTWGHRLGRGPCLLLHSCPTSLTPPGDPAGGGGVSGAEDVPGMVGVYEVLG